MKHSRRRANLARYGPILLILVVSFLLKLPHMSDPPLGIHSWRQADTAGVARNFAQNGFHLLSPQVDWAGDGVGERKLSTVEMEFPIFCFATGVLSQLTGDVAIAGRLLAALGAAVAVFFLHRLTWVCFGRRSARWAAGIYAVLPTSLYYGQAIMPESWMLAASVIGVYGFSLWSFTGKRWPLVWSCAAVASACLLKLPALYLGLPLAWLTFRRLSWRCAVSPEMWLYAIGVAAPVTAWYIHAHNIFTETGLSFGIGQSDKWGSLQPLLSGNWYFDVFLGKIAEDHLTWAGLPVALAGIAVTSRRGAGRLFDFWTLGVVAYIFLVAVGNRAHEYYQLPLMLPLAVLMGRIYAGLERRRRGLGIACAVPLLVLSGMHFAHYMKMQYPTGTTARLGYTLSLRLRETTERGDLVVVVNGVHGGDPTVLYNADRKGWALSIAQLTDERLRTLESTNGGGARLIAGLDNIARTEPERLRLDSIKARYTSAESPPGTFILRIGPTPPLP